MKNKNINNIKKYEYYIEEIITIKITVPYKNSPCIPNYWPIFDQVVLINNYFKSKILVFYELYNSYEKK